MLHFLPFLSLLLSTSHPATRFLPSKCKESCGSLQIPPPFHLNISCGIPIEQHELNPFHLSCFNSSTLFLPIGKQTLRVLDFLPRAVVVDLEAASCHKYSELGSFAIEGNQFYGLSDQNLLRLYGCDDSSICKVECELFSFGGCEGFGKNESFSCCYSLSDSSIWELRDGLEVFSQFGGCRGFSSWVVTAGSNLVKRGLKLEWAVPRDYARDVCAENADFVNASAVKGGVWCSCGSGFVGDGFAEGIGCRKTCIKDGGIVDREDCQAGTHGKKKVIILAGVLGSAFVLAAFATYCLLFKHPIKESRWNPDPVHFTSITEFGKACRTRLFTYKELEEATKGFDENQKLVYETEGIAHAGVLGDGSLVIVQKIQCDNDQGLTSVLNRIAFLSGISHKNITQLIGCCIELVHMPIVVYEFFGNGNLDEHLRQERGQGLDWYQRLTIATETANVLSFLQFQVSPPIHHHDLKSSDIYLDHDHSVKLAGFWRLKPDLGNGFCSYQQLMGRNEVYNFGVLLLEIITGSKHVDLPMLALPKIRDGKLEELVDPFICYANNPYEKDQIQRIADLAVRCLFAGETRIGLTEVARELTLIGKVHVDHKRKGAALEETFSSSSLLQMISMSPDSIYAP